MKLRSNPWRVSRGGCFKGDKVCLKIDGEEQLHVIVEVAGASSLCASLWARPVPWMQGSVCLEHFSLFAQRCNVS